jgi:3-carboxy-cis,cis-muconate cycloisomerase
MRSNLDLSGGMISGEAIMLELGKTIGRQHAHDVVYQAAQAAASQNLSFPDRLAADHRVTAHLSQSAIDALLDPVLRISRRKSPGGLPANSMPIFSRR